MKRFVLGIAAMAGLLFTSCDMGVKDSTSNVGYPTLNLITPLNGDDPDPVHSWYTFKFNLTQQTVMVGTEFEYNKARYKFDSNEITFKQYPPYNGIVYDMSGFRANMNSSASMPLENVKFLLTTNFVYPYYTDYKLDSFYPNKEDQAVGGTAITGVLYTPSNGYAVPVIVASYQVGQDYKVNTFLPDCTYEGTTHTTYPGMGGMESNDTKTIYYRIVIDYTADKAYVVMYRAKFSNSEREPEKKVVYLKDLDVKWGEGSYTIEGTDIVPMTIEGDKLEPNESFTFKSFHMNTVGQEMVNANIVYVVENTMGEHTITYTGNFSGSTVTLPENRN